MSNALLEIINIATKLYEDKVGSPVHNENEDEKYHKIIALLKEIEKGVIQPFKDEGVPEIVSNQVKENIVESLPEVIPEEAKEQVIPEKILEEVKERAVKEHVVPQEIVEDVKKGDKVKWYTFEKEKYNPLDDILRMQLEEAIINGLTEYTFYIEETEFKANLIDMTITNMSTNTFAQILRFTVHSSLVQNPIEECKEPESLMIDIIGNLNQEAHKLPPEWKPCELKRLCKTSPEYKEVKAHFDQSMQNRYKYIVIEKLNNVRSKYFFEKKINQMCSERGVSKESLTLRLFHGTRKTPPETIYNGYESTFDPKYAHKGGRWGTGIYFATRAIYSNSFAYKKGEVMQMFLADVIVGEYYDFGERTQRELIYPPELMPGQEERFDSVKGISSKNDIYVVYDMHMAYPTYMISYSNTVQP